VLANRATGGAGADGGGNGGDGQGGGAWNSTDAALTLTKSWIIGNRAEGGAGGEAGNDGVGIGGGVYNLGDIDVDARTHIFANIADLFANCFGC
jgi:hypothetical protein